MGGAPRAAASLFALGHDSITSCCKPAAPMQAWHFVPRSFRLGSASQCWQRSRGLVLRNRVAVLRMGGSPWTFRYSSTSPLDKDLHMNEKPDETSIFHGHHLEPDGSRQPMPPMPPMPFLGFDGALPSLLTCCGTSTRRSLLQGQLVRDAAFPHSSTNLPCRNKAVQCEEMEMKVQSSAACNKKGHLP